MPNVLPTPSYIADKMLEYLFEGSDVTNNVNRTFESQWSATKDSIGKTLMIKNPPRYVSQDGPVISAVQSTNFGLTPFTIDKWKTVPIKLTGEEKTFNNAKELDMWADANVKPIVSPLISAVETAIFGLYYKVANHVGTPGTGITTNDPILAAREKLSLHETPMENRYFYINPTQARKFGNGMVAIFNPTGALSNQYTSGKIAPVGGFDVREANYITNHVTGSRTSTGSNILTDNATPQVGNIIHMDTWTTGTTLLKGDVFTVAGVYAVNPVTGLSTGQLRQFVVTADATAASNEGDVYVSPAVVVSGAFKNVTGATADITGIPNDAIVTVMTGTASTAYGQNLAWWKDAIGLVTVPIAPLEGVAKSVTKTYKGISITFSAGGDIMNFETIKRVDMAFGVDIFTPYMDSICRVTG